MDTNIAQKVLEENRDFVDAEPLPIDIEGLSNPRVCWFLNRLVAHMDPGEVYLEIGTWKGKTLLSAALDNVGRTCIGCDKFRFWGRYTGFGVIAKRNLLGNIERYRERTATIEFHHRTSRSFFVKAPLSRPVGVYFYDGDHSYEGTHHGVVAAAPFLNNRSVLVVDDWKDPIIARATRDGIKQASLQILWERELPAGQDKHGFWNGLGVFYLEK